MGVYRTLIGNRIRRIEGMHTRVSSATRTAGNCVRYPSNSAFSIAYLGSHVAPSQHQSAELSCLCHDDASVYTVLQTAYLNLRVQVVHSGSMFSSGRRHHCLSMLPALAGRWRAHSECFPILSALAISSLSSLVPTKREQDSAAVGSNHSRSRKRSTQSRASKPTLS